MQFNPAKALLTGMAQLWYVWLILGFVLIGRLVFYFLEQKVIGVRSTLFTGGIPKKVGPII
jgi:hypothetical protein